MTTTLESFRETEGGSQLFVFSQTVATKLCLKKTMQKEIMFWIGMNPMVRLIFKKKKI